MTKTGKIILLVIGSIILVFGLVFAGILVDRLFLRSAYTLPLGYWGMMAGRGDAFRSNPAPRMTWDYSEDETYSYGPGMMYREDYGTCPYSQGYGYHGHGMMGGAGYAGCAGREGFGGMYGPGMMGAYWDVDQDLPVLSLEQAEEAVLVYLEGTEDLHIGEIMIFSNHAYAQIVEESSGIGAFEVLVNPISMQVYPEHGPNMMWNLKYGMHGSSGYYLGEAEISEDEAAAAAQAYLDAAAPGYQADEHADIFYGYYTLHILLDGDVTGMLSVNSFTGDVFPHTWHGEFVEMTGDH